LARGSAAVIVVAVASFLAAAPSAQSKGSGCAQFASRNGNDGASGRADAPVRSIGRLLAGLGKGQTGCLLPGWRLSEHVRVTGGGGLGRPIRILGLGPGRPVLDGVIRVAKSGHDVTFEHIQVEGDGTPGKSIVAIAGSHISFVDGVVTGPHYWNRSIACIRVGGGARGTVLSRMRVHDCTRAGTRRLYAPGIVVSDATGTVISRSIVRHTIGDAIALAPAARRGSVTRTILDSNTSGIYIGGTSSGNYIAQNTISYSGKWSVHGSGSSSRGNRVTRNCLWRGYGGNVAGGGFAAYGNLVASPRYVHHSTTLRMEAGPCAAKSPAGAGGALRAAPSPRPAARPHPAPAAHRLGRFLVQYRLLGLKGRVQVVGLTFLRLKPGSSVDVRCVRRCSARERLPVASDGTASSGALLGRWLPRGAVVAVSEHRKGWIPASARITIVGLPRGVRVAHGAG
jgi:hypothetical protein